MSGGKYIDSGDYFEITAPSGGLSAGDVVFDAMNRCGIVTSLTLIAEGQKTKAQARGRVELPALSTDEWAAGDLVYWDAGNSRLTDTPSSHKVAGRADVAKTNGQTTNIILLNDPGPSFIDTDT